MDRLLMENEIKKFNPNIIDYYDSRVIKWDYHNPILSNELLKDLFDCEIEELYLKLKIGSLIANFGVVKFRNVFTQFENEES